MSSFSQRLLAALLAACAAILIVGCAEQIRTAVPVACIEKLPPETPAPQLTGNAIADVAILAVTVLELRKEVVGLRAVAEPCLR